MLRFILKRQRQVWFFSPSSPTFIPLRQRRGSEPPKMFPALGTLSPFLFIVSHCKSIVTLGTCRWTDEDLHPLQNHCMSAAATLKWRELKASKSLPACSTWRLHKEITFPYFFLNLSSFGHVETWLTVTNCTQKDCVLCVLSVGDDGGWRDECRMNSAKEKEAAVSWFLSHILPARLKQPPWRSNTQIIRRLFSPNNHLGL